MKIYKYDFKLSFVSILLINYIKNSNNIFVLL